MLNYVRAELYKVTHRAYPYLFLIVVAALELLLIGGMALANVGTDYIHADATALIMVLFPMLSTGLYLTFIVGDMVFSEQYKHGTLKNEISFGISRSRIYLGKLMTEAILGVILVLVIVGLYIGLGLVLLPSDQDTGMILRLLANALVGAIPLYLGALGVAHLFFSNVKSSVAASILPAVLIAMSGSAMGMAADYAPGAFGAVAKVVYPVLLTTPFDKMGGDLGWPFILNAWAIGFTWLIVTTLLGLTLFSKKEIN
ncbi:MAG: hypothetical protein EOM52_04110 [Clostridia bacterium]|nr:hypothetical protein [Clostridia bacterium]